MADQLAGGARQSDPKTVGLMEPRSFALSFVYFAWFMFLFEPEWFLASFGFGLAKRLFLLMFPVLVAIAIFPNGRRRVCWPLAIFLVLHTLALPFVLNRGAAMDGPWKVLLQVFTLYAASLATIDTVRRALPLVTMYLASFAWWVLHGLPGGKVPWHYYIGDENGYGAFIGIGLGFATMMAMGRHRRRSRVIAALVAGLCAVGVVASFSRGSFLAAGVVMVAGWIRSPRKLRTGVILVLLGVAGVIAANMLFPAGAYWDEMWTIKEGYEDVSGNDRRVLWDAGWMVFLRNPLMGVGAGNFGVYVSQTFAVGEAEPIGKRYADPGHFWGRSLHSLYYQLLAEQGIIGSLVFLWLLIDFVRRNWALRRPEAVAWWSAAAGDRYDLRAISRGLEVGLVAFLLTSAFYEQLYNHELYSLLGLNLVLSAVTDRDSAAVKADLDRLPERSASGAIPPRST